MVYALIANSLSSSYSCCICMQMVLVSSFTDLSLCVWMLIFLNVDFGPDFRLLKKIPLLKSKKYCSTKFNS